MAVGEGVLKVANLERSVALMTDHTASVPGSLNVASPSPVARLVARIVAWLSIAVAAAVLLIRVAPDDALGAVALAGGVSTGVVLLVLAVLLFGAFLLERRFASVKGMDRVAQGICLVLGIITAVLGALSL
ncbi:MAG: hypothetical protein K0S37_349 [Microbacterium sp.]|nr:hypothetical protein [Microbacterium sp.]